MVDDRVTFTVVVTRVGDTMGANEVAVVAAAAPVAAAATLGVKVDGVETARQVMNVMGLCVHIATGVEHFDLTV